MSSQEADGKLESGGDGRPFKGMLAVHQEEVRRSQPLHIPAEGTQKLRVMVYERSIETLGQSRVSDSNEPVL